jgi:hypothetical protein
MKIAVLALASAAVVAFAYPALAQQNMNRDQSNQIDRLQHGSGMQGQIDNDDEESGASGQGNNWADRADWRAEQNGRGDHDGGHMHHWGMRGNMQGGMTPPWRMHERMAHENGAAHFRFRRGPAMVDVQCPENASLQACVNATSQLLDKIAANMRNRNAEGATSGSNLGSEEEGTSEQPQSGGSMSNQLLNRRSGSGGGQSGR